MSKENGWKEKKGMDNDNDKYDSLYDFKYLNKTRN